MSEVGLALLVSLEDHEVIDLDKGIKVRGKMAFTLCCSETGATETRHLVGEAADQAKVSDKAFYKLYTTLEKYYLKTTFLISSGEELDSDADEQRSAQQTARTNDNRNGMTNGMTLAKLLTNLNKVERIRGFYDSPAAIKSCRKKSAELPGPDDTEGWRQLFVDARNWAFEQIDRAVEDGKISPDQISMSEEEAVQSAMGEVETDSEIPF
jgi:hypothetical protein